jgi:hypothetical protein
MSDLRTRIAATIRRVDGNHTMGATALADAIVDEIFQATDEVFDDVRAAIRKQALDRFTTDYLAEDAREWLAGFSARAALSALGFAES